MRYFLDEASMSGVCSAPMAVPQVELVARSGGLPISQFRLLPGQILSLPYLVLHFIGFSTLGYTGRVNTGLPTLYAGLFYQAGLSVGAYEAVPIMTVGIDAPGVAVLNNSAPMTFTAPGTYHVMLVNNHASSSIYALVTGAAQIFNVTTTNG